MCGASIVTDPFVCISIFISPISFCLISLAALLSLTQSKQLSLNIGTLISKRNIMTGVRQANEIPVKREKYVRMLMFYCRLEYVHYQFLYLSVMIK